MKTFFIHFAIRWLASSLGLWIAAAILGTDKLSVGDDLLTVAGAGFFLALVNMALKPILVIFSFPAIILTLGIFMLVINALILLVASWIYDPLSVDGFWTAVVAGIIVGLVNYLVSRIVKDFK